MARAAATGMKAAPLDDMGRAHSSSSSAGWCAQESKSRGSTEKRLVTWDSNSDVEVPVKEVLAAKIMEVRRVMAGNPSSGISPTIPHTSGKSSSYSLPFTRKREWIKSTHPAPKIIDSTRRSTPADRREMRLARNSRMPIPGSAVAPTPMLKPVLALRLSSEDEEGLTFHFLFKA